MLIFTQCDQGLDNKVLIYFSHFRCRTLYVIDFSGKNLDIKQVWKSRQCDSSPPKITNTVAPSLLLN